MQTTNFIKLADVFILSSKFEGLPNVLLEAASYNKYIISSDCKKPDQKEIINSYRYGKLYKQGDVLELKSILDKLDKNKIIKIKDYTNNLNKFNYNENLKKYYNVLKN